MVPYLRKLPDSETMACHNGLGSGLYRAEAETCHDLGPYQKRPSRWGMDNRFCHMSSTQMEPPAENTPTRTLAFLRPFSMGWGHHIFRSICIHEHTIHRAPCPVSQLASARKHCSFRSFSRHTPQKPLEKQNTLTVHITQSPTGIILIYS